jgi:hypothetical protein
MFAINTGVLIRGLEIVEQAGKHDREPHREDGEVDRALL